VKILQLIDIPWDSGLAHYALTLSVGLKKRGHQVYISALPGAKPWAKAKRLGLRTVPLATLKTLTSLRRFLKKHHIQLLNAHTGSTHSLAVAATMGQKVAVVRTRSDARTVKKKIGGQWLFKHTQRVIAAADYIHQEYLTSLKLKPSKVVTVYQGIDLDPFHVAPLPKIPIAGIVARLDPVKGHQYALEALLLIKDVYPQFRLRIIGQEENIKQHELESMAGEMGLSDRVSFLGWQKDIPSQMAMCSFGIIPSIGSEAVSRGALEWMAAGRPVLATRVGCLPELIQEGNNGLLVEAENAVAIAGGLNRFLHNPDQLDTMGKNAREMVENQFSFDHFVEKSESVYQDALADVQ